MKHPDLRHPVCNLCGLDNSQIIQKAEDSFNVVKCNNCGLIYVAPRPSQELLEKHYQQEDYYQEWVEKQMPKRILMWKKRLKQLKKYKKEGRLLDVGCGLGTFLQITREDGFEVFGTEISAYACQYAKKERAMDVIKGNLEDAKFSSSYFDVISIWHVLEHLPDPQGTLRAIYRVLKPEGLLVVAVPNVDNFIMRILYRLIKRKDLQMFSVRDKELHLYHFSEETLSALLERAGFKIIEINIDANQIEFSKKVIDWLAYMMRLIVKKNLGNAMEVYAIKQ